MQNTAISSPKRHSRHLIRSFNPTFTLGNMFEPASYFLALSVDTLSSTEFCYLKDLATH